jgi:Leucine-rich repeat (LRR) protein
MKIHRFTRCITGLVLFVSVLSAIIPSPVVHAAPISTRLAAPASPAAFDCSQVTSIPQAECQALVALYQGTSGTGWTNQTGWLANTTPCTWYGVTCTSGHVTTINLYSNLLKGPLPPEISGLTELTSLILANNQLSGAIPAQLGSLSKLEILYLAFNQFSGPIPPELGNLANLKYFVLQSNQLSGALPPELGNLANQIGRAHV